MSPCARQWGVSSARWATIVREFPSAEAFLASSSLAETACLIADVQMPGGMSGLDLQDALRTQGNPLPIILITAFPTDAIRKRAQAAGASGFFGKPVDIQKLISCLDAVLNEPRS